MSTVFSIDDLINDIDMLGDYSIVERFTTPARPEKIRALPAGFSDPLYRRVLNALTGQSNAVWTHQGEALDVVDNNMSPVLTTRTASGKSLVFELPALKKIIQDPAARVLGFYPTKALNQDQLLSWRKVVEVAGLPAETLGLIDGSVTDMNARLDILEKSRITIMTPDVVHAWLLGNLRERKIQDFIRNIQLKILDEAHLYDGSFGTHVAYMLRRLLLAQIIINPDFSYEKNGQMIAASATMHDPDKFLKRLTSIDFYSIGMEFDGSPLYERKFALVGVPDYQVRRAVQNFLTVIGQQDNLPGTTLAFIDNRRVVDEMAYDINARLGASQEEPAFYPYRAGFIHEDRLAIEEAMRQGLCKGVLSTSALEVGIHMDGIRQVVMSGLPDDSANFRQRGGRIRTGGHVIVFEEKNKIRDRALSLRKKWDEPPAQPILYRTNSKVIAEEAICLLDEMEQLGIEDPREIFSNKKKYPVSWPIGFRDVIERYVRNEDLSDEMIRAFPPHGMKPHLYHSLRTFDGPHRRIVVFNPALEKSVKIGEVSQSQALSEAYPGAVIFYRGKTYRVREWSAHKSPDRPIKARALTDDEYASKLRTRPFVQTSLTTYINDLRVQKKHFKKNSDGDFLADCKITISRRVTGFSEKRGKEYTRVFYDKHENKHALKDAFVKEVAGAPPQKFEAPPISSYDTTGVVLRITDKWFSRRAARRIAAIMRQAVCEEFTLSQKDIHVAVSGIHVGLTSSGFIEDRTLILYDKTPGSLYLSRKLFEHFPRVINRMLALCGDKEMEEWILKLQNWQESLRLSKVPSYSDFISSHLPKEIPPHIRKIYAPRSVLEWKKPGSDQPVRVMILAVDMHKNEVVYSLQEVRYAYNPYRDKGLRSEEGNKPRAKAETYLYKQFATAAQLSEPPAPTYRMALFNTVTREITHTLDASTRANDNERKTGGGKPKARPA